MKKPKRHLPDLEIACSTDPGSARVRNEDACALPPAWADPRELGTLLVVADGVGGLPGGAEASREAVEYLQAIYYAPTGPGKPDERLNLAVRAVNTLNRCSPARIADNERLTTMVAAVIRSESLWVANVGDSRAYLCHAGANQPRQLTKDHTGARSHAITQAIGLVDDCQVDLYRYEWGPGDALVLCSDGLAALPGHEMSRMVLSLPAEQAAEALVKTAGGLDGSDNATAVVARHAAGAAGTRRTTAGRAPGRGSSDTLPARPGPVRGRPARRPARYGWPLLFGLLLGWLTAALLIYAAAAGGFIPGL